MTPEREPSPVRPATDTQSSVAADQYPPGYHTAIEADVDRALASGNPVVVAEWCVAILPDTHIAAGVSTGLSMPPLTTRVERCDGRWALLYRLPKGALR